MKIPHILFRWKLIGYGVLLGVICIFVGALLPTEFKWGVRIAKILFLVWCGIVFVRIIVERVSSGGKQVNSQERSNGRDYVP